MRQDSQEEPLKTQLSGAHRVRSYLIGKEAQWAQLSSIWTPMAKAMPLQWIQPWYLNHGWLGQICMWPSSKEVSASEGPGRISAQQGQLHTERRQSNPPFGEVCLLSEQREGKSFLTLADPTRKTRNWAEKDTSICENLQRARHFAWEACLVSPQISSHPCCIHDVTSVRTKSQQAMHSWVKGWEEPCWCYYWAAEPILAIN